MSFRRKMKRQIARNHMNELGYKRLNKKRNFNGNKTSTYALNWRYILGKEGIE